MRVQPPRRHGRVQTVIRTQLPPPEEAEGVVRDGDGVPGILRHPGPATVVDDQEEGAKRAVRPQGGRLQARDQAEVVLLHA